MAMPPWHNANVMNEIEFPSPGHLSFKLPECARDNIQCRYQHVSIIASSFEQNWKTNWTNWKTPRLGVKMLSSLHPPCFLGRYLVHACREHIVNYRNNLVHGQRKNWLTGLTAVYRLRISISVQSIMKKCNVSFFFFVYLNYVTENYNTPPTTIKLTLTV